MGGSETPTILYLVVKYDRNANNVTYLYKPIIKALCKLACLLYEINISTET